VKFLVHDRRARRVRARRRQGFTLIELAVATSILMIGLVSVLSATSQMHSLRRSNRERTVAMNALRSMAERIHATSHEFSDDPTTWATDLLATYGPNGTHGNRFQVEELDVAGTAPAVGTIEIVTSETSTDGQLRAELGMPRDLNADGDAADEDVSASARILPVLLTLRWRSERGERVIHHAFYVLGY
jgi:prepilin-type N-terminal cleavage/methylation domain-containing protein